MLNHSLGPGALLNMQNRRNFYRILQVQPDAPVAVIKNNYRTLLQKLRLHPDLGGDHHTASQINQAYKTLRDPQLRATYDKQLLKDFHIQELSQGALAGKFSTPPKMADSAKIRISNRRNYYRILNIQTDAPAAIITASYQFQMKSPLIPINLIQEAYAVLSDPQQRRLYDQHIIDNSHIGAEEGEPPTPHPGNQNVTQYPAPPLSTSSPEPSVSVPGRPLYQPLITQFCHFCKTPHAQSPSGGHDELCVVCASPLFSPPRESRPNGQRGASRIVRHGHLKFYLDWPGQPQHGTLTDLSPDGLRFNTTQRLEQEQLIKVENEDFLCVAKVMHRQSDPAGISIGSRFITVLFNTQRGNFVSARA